MRLPVCLTCNPTLAQASMTPMFTRPTTRTRRAIKKTSVGHSTSSRNWAGVVRKTRIIVPAPGRAMRDGWTGRAECSEEATATRRTYATHEVEDLRHA